MNLSDTAHLLGSARVLVAARCRVQTIGLLSRHRPTECGDRAETHLLLIAALLAIATAAHAAAPRVGGSAPSVVLQSADGSPVTLEDFRGRVVLLDFWASWCATCATALPRLDAIARRFRGDGVVVLAAGIDDARTRADRFIAERLPRSSMVFVYDPGGKTLAQLGAEWMPALYLVDRDGTVRAVEAGYAPERLDAVERAVASLIGGAPSAPQSQKDTPPRSR